MKSTTIDVQTYSVGGSFLRLEQVTADNSHLHYLPIYYLSIYLHIYLSPRTGGSPT